MVAIPIHVLLLTSCATKLLIFTYKLAEISYFISSKTACNSGLV